MDFNGRTEPNDCHQALFNNSNPQADAVQSDQSSAKKDSQIPSSENTSLTKPRQLKIKLASDDDVSKISSNNSGASNKPKRRTSGPNVVVVSNSSTMPTQTDLKQQPVSDSKLPPASDTSAPPKSDGVVVTTANSERPPAKQENAPPPNSDAQLPPREKQSAPPPAKSETVIFQAAASDKSQIQHDKSQSYATNKETTVVIEPAKSKSSTAPRTEMSQSKIESGPSKIDGIEKTEKTKGLIVGKTQQGPARDAYFAAAVAACLVSLAASQTNQWSTLRLLNFYSEDTKTSESQTIANYLEGEVKAKHVPGLMISIFVGNVIGVILGAHWMYKYGRVWTMHSSALAMLAGFLALAESRNRYITQLVFRVGTGIACGMGLVVVPNYIMEISPPLERIFLGGCIEIANAIGEFFIAALWAFMPNDYVVLLVALTPSALYLVLYETGYLIQSPRWLVSRGDKATAAIMHQKLYAYSDPVMKYDPVRPPAPSTINKLMISQAILGASLSCVTQTRAYFLTDNMFDVPRGVMVLGLLAVMVFALIFATVVGKRFSHRMLTTLTLSVSIFCYVFYFFVWNLVDVELLEALLIMITSASRGVGLQTVFYLKIGLLYPVENRRFQCAVPMISYFATSGLLMSLMSSVPAGPMLLLCVIICFFSITFATKYVLETTGKPFEEIHNNLDADIKVADKIPWRDQLEVCFACLNKAKFSRKQANYPKGNKPASKAPSGKQSMNASIMKNTGPQQQFSNTNQKIDYPRTH